MGHSTVAQFTGRRLTGNTWWGLLLIAAGAIITALLVADPGEDSGYLLVVVVLILSVGTVVLGVDVRRARRVSASATGLTLTDGLGRRRVVPWTSLRRVRTHTERGFPGRDDHLALADGHLVPVAAGLPDGSIERWRQAWSAPGPDPASLGNDERVWRIPVKKLPDWLLLLQVPNLVFLTSGPWAGYSLALLLAMLVVLAVVAGINYRDDRREVRADTDGLLLPRFRGPLRVRWADVVAIGGTSGEWDDEPRLELRDGTTVPIPFSVPATVVAHWKEELAPEPR